MSRIIKFRVWDKNEKKMYDVQSINFARNELTVDFYLCPYSLDRVPLMQFTGLLDKNGKELFEGDIVRYGFFALNDINKFGNESWNNLPEGVKDSDITTEHMRYVVEWNFNTLDMLRSNISNNPDVMGVEIIGNVYEHPHLLQSSEQ